MLYVVSLYNFIHCQQLLRFQNIIKIIVLKKYCNVQNIMLTIWYFLNFDVGVKNIRLLYISFEKLKFWMKLMNEKRQVIFNGFL